MIGLLIVAAGLYLAFGFSGSYIGNDSGTAEFGADFYTYQYKATRNAATNVENLGLFTRDVAQFGFRASYCYCHFVYLAFPVFSAFGAFCVLYS